MLGPASLHLSALAVGPQAHATPMGSGYKPGGLRAQDRAGGSGCSTVTVVTIPNTPLGTTRTLPQADVLGILASAPGSVQKGHPGW